MSPPSSSQQKVSFVNLALGASLNIFEISTLGQPFEVVKTHMAANRTHTLYQSLSHTFQRGGFSAFYQGLIPWAWIEASTKGAVLLFTSSELERLFAGLGFGTSVSGIMAGMGGGVAQAYTTMGFCTFMKTVEITRHKEGKGNVSTLSIARDILKKEGIMGINKGVNAVALRQMTKLGLSRFAESTIKGMNKDKEAPLSPLQKIFASALGGALSCWNQPIEVIRVEMQSQVKQVGRPEKMSMIQTAKWIYEKNGFRGFYRGVVPRVGLGVWQTICMVAGGDALKEKVKKWQQNK